MTDIETQPKKQIWAGVIAILAMVMSFHLHRIYGKLHWPGADPQKTRTAILDILHLDSMIVALFALGLSVICLLKGNRILGLIATALSIGAVMNSLICF